MKILKGGVDFLWALYRSGVNEVKIEKMKLILRKRKECMTEGEGMELRSLGENGRLGGERGVWVSNRREETEKGERVKKNSPMLAYKINR